MQNVSSGFPNPVDLFCQVCRKAGCCNSHTEVAKVGNGVASFDAERLSELNTLAKTALGNLYNHDKVLAAAASKDAISQLHFTSRGDALATASFADGYEGNVVLRGTIGPFPYEIHINFKIDLPNKLIKVTLDVNKPIDLPPYTWEFKLGGLRLDSNGNVLAVSSITPSENMKPLDATAAGISWWCVLKCGGLGILPTLLLCIPALVAGGPAGYVACVVAKAGETAAGIAVCVAENCL